MTDDEWCTDESLQEIYLPGTNALRANCEHYDKGIFRSGGVFYQPGVKDWDDGWMALQKVLVLGPDSILELFEDIDSVFEVQICEELMNDG